MKATVVLFFFLGMSSLLFCINPKDEGIYEDAYMVTNAILKVTYKKISNDKMLMVRGLKEASCASFTVFSPPT